MNKQLLKIAYFLAAVCSPLFMLVHRRSYIFRLREADVAGSNPVTPINTIFTNPPFFHERERYRLRYRFLGFLKAEKTKTQTLTFTFTDI